MNNEGGNESGGLMEYKAKLDEDASLLPKIKKLE